MKVELKEYCCIVTREKGDKKIYGDLNAAGESLLLYKVKQELIKQGHKVIKKRMYKDGHLVDDLQQYICTVKGYKPSFYVYNNHFALWGANDSFNRGEVILTVERKIWKDES